MHSKTQKSNISNKNKMIRKWHMRKANIASSDILCLRKNTHSICDTAYKTKHTITKPNMSHQNTDTNINTKQILKKQKRTINQTKQRDHAITPDT